MREPIKFESPHCAEVGTDIFFPEPGETAKYAKTICGGCPHKAECLDWSLHHELYGVWGGYTERERRFIRRSRGILYKDVVNLA